MQKKELSDDKLTQVRELRQAGNSWLAIQKTTGVERRLAKRAYNDWLDGRSLNELKRARVNVATKALSEHLDSLVKLAERLTDHLDLPRSPQKLKSANEHLGILFETNIFGESYELSQVDIKRKSQRNRRRNQKLFKCLQDHTREKVRWKALDEWKQACNNALDYSKELRLEATKLIGETLSKEPELKERIETATGVNDITEKIADGVRENIWRGILAGKPERVHVWGSVSKGRAELRFYEGDSDTKLDLNDVELGKDALSKCLQVVTDLREVTILREGTKSNLVQRLTDEVRKMQDRTRELDESLDELLLRPMILRTRCDLCPA